MTDRRPPRLVLCLGRICNATGAAADLYAQLEAILAESDPFDPPFILRTANCLDMCGQGPNLAIHPGNIRHTGLDAEKLAAVLEAHVCAMRNLDEAG